MQSLYTAFLGAIVINIGSSHDLDDCVQYGVFYIWGNTVPGHSLNSKYSCAFNIILAGRSLGDNIMQVMINRAPLKIFVRNREDGVFSSWKQVTLSELTQMCDIYLGGLNNTFYEERFVGDVDTLIPEYNHLSIYIAWSGCTNLPTGVAAGYLIAFSWTHSYYGKQILITDNLLYHRNKTGENTWSNWTQI